MVSIPFPQINVTNHCNVMAIKSLAITVLSGTVHCTMTLSGNNYIMEVCSPHPQAAKACYPRSHLFTLALDTLKPS